MLKLLEIQLDQYSSESCIYLSWDAASWHASKRLFARVNEINDPDYRTHHRVPHVAGSNHATGFRFCTLRRLALLEVWPATFGDPRAVGRLALQHLQ